MSNKIGDFLEKTLPFYSILQYVFIVAYLVFAILPFPVMIGFFIATPFLNFLLYIFYKDYMENKHLGWIIFMIQATVYLSTVPLYLFKLLESKINISVPVPIKIVFTICAFVFVFALLISDSNKKEEKMNEIRVKDRIRGGNGGENDHDVLICINKDTKENVFIKYLDRFVHLLVIGPTGCGKTSQILLPMIIQDIMKGHGVIVLEPKSDYAVKAYATSKYYGQDSMYFDPREPDCPKYNPLDVKESEAIENMTTIFEMLAPESITYYKDLASNLLRNAIRMLKRMEMAYMNYDTGISMKPATLLVLNDVLQNTSNRGRQMVNEFLKIPAITPAEKKENEDIARYFLDNYYADKSIIWQNTSGVRTQVANLNNNEDLRRVLNPENGKSDINFSDIIENERQIFITTAQGELKNLNKYLGYFLMFSIQSAILSRPGDENTRKPCYWYLDEFQTYANPGFSTILQQGRSYRVSAILATQSRNAIKLDMGNAGDAFLSVIQTNARSQILFPGLDPDDAKYYSLAFGEEKQKEIQKGVTRQKFEIGHGFKETNYPSVQERYIEKDMARFSPTQLTEKKFSEITYRRILDNDVTVAQTGIVNFIDPELNHELNDIVNRHIEEQVSKRAAKEREIYEAKRQLYTNYQTGKAGGYGTLGSRKGASDSSYPTNEGYMPEDKLGGNDKSVPIE